jgi:hypothetical protein
VGDWGGGARDLQPPPSVRHISTTNHPKNTKSSAKESRQRQDSNLRARRHMISNGVRVIPINHSGTLSCDLMEEQKFIENIYRVAVVRQRITNTNKVSNSHRDSCAWRVSPKVGHFGWVLQGFQASSARTLACGPTYTFPGGYTLQR